MRETNLWHAGWVLVLGGWISLAGACSGGENENSDRSNRSTASAGDPATGRDQPQNQSNRGQNPGSDSDDHVRHHAALGVLIGTSTDGVSVVGIIPGSPAALAGLRVGDVIRQVGDQRIGTTQGLNEEIRQYQPGSPVDLTIRRNGERRIVRATLASQESASPSRHQVNRIAANANDSSLKNNSGRRGGAADPSSQRIRRATATNCSAATRSRRTDVVPRRAASRAGEYAKRRLGLGRT